MPNRAASNMFCGICQEKMNRREKKPLVLPACGHSFCRECLIRMNEVEGRIDCPICRIPHQGQPPENLPVNWLLVDLLDDEETSKVHKANENTKEAPISPNQSSKDYVESNKSSKDKDPGDGKNNKPPSTFWRNVGIGAGSVIGGVGLVAAVPVVLTGVGFTSAGIAAGSWAASMMSSAAIANGGGVAAGSLVSIKMSLLPEKCLCFSLRTGTVAQGVLCLVIGCVNVLMVLLGLGDFLDKRIYDFCWPSEDCYDKMKSLEKTIVIANIVVNAFAYMFSILLLLGVRNNNPRYLVPFMFVQGLVASALVPAALMALVICAHVGSCLEKILISLCALVYIIVNVYLALVVRAYYNKMKKNRTPKELANKIDQIFDNKKELTLEDYVF